VGPLAGLGRPVTGRAPAGQPRHGLPTQSALTVLVPSGRAPDHARARAAQRAVAERETALASREAAVADAARGAAERDAALTARQARARAAPGGCIGGALHDQNAGRAAVVSRRAL